MTPSYPPLEELLEHLLKEVYGREILIEAYRRVASGECGPELLSPNTVILACQISYIIFRHVDEKEKSKGEPNGDT